MVLEAEVLVVVLVEGVGAAWVASPTEASAVESQLQVLGEGEGPRLGGHGLDWTQLESQR